MKTGITVSGATITLEGNRITYSKNYVAYKEVTYPSTHHAESDFKRFRVEKRRGPQPLHRHTKVSVNKQIFQGPLIRTKK